MGHSTDQERDAGGALSTEQALVAIEEHRRTQEKIASQKAWWAEYVGTGTGSGVGKPVSDADVLAFLAEHRATVELVATQKALWRSHVEAMFGPHTTKLEPMADPNIVAYYKLADPARKPADPRATRKTWERQAWTLLRDKLTAMNGEINENAGRGTICQS